MICRCFNSFPDSNSDGLIGDNTFYFRFRSEKATQNIYSNGVVNPAELFDTSFVSLHSPADSSNVGIGILEGTDLTAPKELAPDTRVSSHAQTTSNESLINPNLISPDFDGHIYAYVFFRQQKDALVKRGYFQVILSIITRSQLKQ